MTTIKEIVNQIKNILLTLTYNQFVIYNKTIKYYDSIKITDKFSMSLEVELDVDCVNGDFLYFLSYGYAAFKCKSFIDFEKFEKQHCVIGINHTRKIKLDEIGLKITFYDTKFGKIKSFSNIATEKLFTRLIKTTNKSTTKIDWLVAFQKLALENL